MPELPFEKVAFIFSDPAGANACIAMAEMHREATGFQAGLYSNRQLPGENESFTLTETSPDLQMLGVDCIFTGTSHPDSSKNFEVNAIRQAKKLGIYSISFIDHWVNFKLRFSSLNIEELPDEIWVVDEEAKELAIKDGLPEEKLRIRDNPHLVRLKKHWRSAYTGKNYLEELGIQVDGFHVLFAPDPLSLRNGKKIAGFTEFEALDDLLSVLQTLPDPVSLIIKTHPLQPAGSFQTGSYAGSIANINLVAHADTIELVSCCDLVIGFYSNILLEAEVLGKATLRYFPGHPEADLLRYNRTIVKASTKQELNSHIKAMRNG